MQTASTSDLKIVRVCLLFLAGCLVVAPLSAQSHPAWWRYVPPDSTAVVGIQWKTARSTLLASAIRAELGPEGVAGLDDLSFLEATEQFLIAGPSMLVIAKGSFPGEIRLLGPPEVVEEALQKKPERRSSPLIARGARYAQEDLWIVASALPDPLASRFIPMDLRAKAFEGSVSVWDGLHLVAAIEARNPQEALGVADALTEELAARPAMDAGTEIETRYRTVLVRMDLTPRQVAASLRLPMAPPAATALPEPAPLKTPRGTIRIHGLGGDVREIPIVP